MPEEQSTDDHDDDSVEEELPPPLENAWYGLIDDNGVRQSSRIMYCKLYIPFMICSKPWSLAFGKRNGNELHLH